MLAGRTSRPLIDPALELELATLLDELDELVATEELEELDKLEEIDELIELDELDKLEAIEELTELDKLDELVASAELDELLVALASLLDERWLLVLSPGPASEPPPPQADVAKTNITIKAVIPVRMARNLPCCISRYRQ